MKKKFFWLMISHNSHRFLHSFPFFSLFSSDWIIGDLLRVHTFSSDWSSPLWCTLLCFSSHPLYSSAPEFLFGFFYNFYLSLELLILMVYCFPDFVELPIFSFSSHNFLRLLILNSLSVNLQISISLRSVTGKWFQYFLVVYFLECLCFL